MYRVEHRFDDVSEGVEIRWNAATRVVEEVGDDYLVIEGKTLPKSKVNDMFESHDVPFELV